MRVAHLVVAFSLFAAGCDRPSTEAPANAAVPALTGRVVDQANLLRPEEEQALSGLSEQLERTTTDQLVMVTLPDLGGRPIDEVGLALGNAWGIGQRDKDNGVLIIVASNDRKVRIEVGYGLERILTDQRAKQIIDAEMLPLLREHRWNDAFQSGARAVSSTLTANAHVARQGR